MPLSHRIPFVPTVQAAQYVSGNSIGGLLKVTIERGILTDFTIDSASGQTPTITAYLFGSMPQGVGTNITDKAAMMLAESDVNRLICAPIALTLAAPTGSSATFASVANLGLPFHNVDGSLAPSLLYVVLISGSTFTPGSVSADFAMNFGVDAD